jgi:tetratricopeptide (TPR) repeat protein
VTGHAEIEPEWLADLEAVQTPGSVVYRRSEERRQPVAEKQPLDARHDAETTRCRSALLARAKQIVERIDRQRGITSHGVGRMLADAGRTEAAVVTLERALRRQPLDVQARYLLALLELERDRQAAGEAHLRKVLLLAPDHLPALLCLGRRLKERGQTGEAASLFGRMRLLLHGREDREQVLYADGLTVGEVRGILRPLGEE